MHDDGLTHKVEITISGNYGDGHRQYASVALCGDGGLEHMMEAFKAALVAAGFSMDTAKNFLTILISDWGGHG